MVNKICGFEGTLDEVWEHARTAHNVIGQCNLVRKDGYNFVDTESGDYVGNGKTITNKNGMYIFVCNENHVHDWKIGNNEYTPFECKICGKVSYTRPKHFSITNEWIVGVDAFKAECNKMGFKLPEPKD